MGKYHLVSADKDADLSNAIIRLLLLLHCL